MEVACNLAPFAAASNNNLNPIMEQATLELESSDDSNEEMPTVLEPQVHSGTFCLFCVQSGIIFWVFMHCKYAVWVANNLATGGLLESKHTIANTNMSRLEAHLGNFLCLSTVTF